jgi:1,5-anhydro-D-fructose reductase (1,5-anhydro-D-mannitol-forming)
MTYQINWGIIGCGDVCEVKSGPAFNKIAGSKLVAVMRRNAVKAEDFARRHAVPKFYTDAEQLINDTEVNAIYIATPPSTHEEYTEMALKEGKLVYVEKPISVSAASVERMIALEKQYNGKVAVAHYRRSLPLFSKVKQLIQENTIGKIKLVLLNTLQPVSSKIITKTEDNWRLNSAISGGGLFYDLSPHQLDIMYWLFGEPLQATVFSANQGKYYDAPDITMLQAQFTNDVYLNGSWNFNVAECAAEDSCTIIGDKGTICFSFFKAGTIEVMIPEGKIIFEESYPIHIQEPHIKNVINYFRGEAASPCSLQDALVTMKIIEKSMGW